MNNSLTITRSKKVALVLLFYASSLAFFIQTASRYDIYSDEAYHVTAAKGLVLTGIPWQWNYYSGTLAAIHTDGYTRGLSFTRLLSWVGQNIGWDIRTLRMVPYFCFLAMLLLGHIFLERNNPKGIPLYIILMIYSAPMLLMSQYIRMYSLLGLILLASSVFVIFASRYIEEYKSKVTILMVICVWIVLMSCYFISIIEVWQYQQILFLLFFIIFGIIYLVDPPWFASKKFLLLCLVIYLVSPIYIILLQKIFDTYPFIAFPKYFNFLALIRISPVLVFYIPFIFESYFRINDKSRTRYYMYFIHLLTFSLTLTIYSTLFINHRPISADYRYIFVGLIHVVISIAALSNKKLFSKSRVVWLSAFVFFQLVVTGWTIKNERSNLAIEICNHIDIFRNSTILSLNSDYNIWAAPGCIGMDSGIKIYETRYYRRAADGNQAGSGAKRWSVDEVEALLKKEREAGRKIYYATKIIGRNHQFENLVRNLSGRKPLKFPLGWFGKPHHIKEENRILEDVLWPVARIYLVENN